MRFIVLLAFCSLLISPEFAGAQTPTEKSGTKSEVPPGEGVPPRKPVATLVDNLYVVPYITGSFNLHSGLAFPQGASGIGYGGGVEFDLTRDAQKAGVLFDFAFQDMRAFKKAGSVVTPNSDQPQVLQTADAEHYWQYVLLETFLKLQSANTKGYFLVGASFGLATVSQTVSVGESRTEFSLWEGTAYGNSFRLDLRAGLGVILANIGTHKLLFEARFGYPLTTAITDYKNVASGGQLGSWRIVTLQGNLGIRL